MAFETSEQHSHQNQRPVRVPTLKGDIYNAAVEMAEDLDGWEVLSKDDAELKLTCRRPGGFLKGTATITVWVEGPDGMPSSTVHVRSETARQGQRDRVRAAVPSQGVLIAAIGTRPPWRRAPGAKLP